MQMSSKKMKLRLHLPTAKNLRRMTSDSGEMSQLTLTKTFNARRRRLKIQRLKYTCQGDSVKKRQVVLDNKESDQHETSSLPREDGIVLSGYEDKACKRSESFTCVSHGLVSVIGRRREMEDAVKVELGFMVKGGEKYDFFGVYDGHGGARVAEECREKLHGVLVEEMGGSTHDWEKVMVGCFEKMDEEVNRGRFEEEMVGSTAVVAVVGKEEVVVANCGDSRAVIFRGGVAVPLSNDHKPDRPDELERVEAAGGRVINWNGHRVLGVLATSRSIGDQYLKPYVISKPEVTVCKRTDNDEFLILASDGLWDVISNEVACHIVRKCLNGQMRRKSLEVVNENRATEAAALLAELAMARVSGDNISVIVVELRKPTSFFS